LLGSALPTARQVVRMLEDKAERIEYAGSLRRMKETVHDVDILAAASRPDPVMKAFLGLPIVRRVLAAGDTKSSILTIDDIQVDLRVVEPKHWGAAFIYFTGSKDHNIRLRERAIK